MGIAIVSAIAVALVPRGSTGGTTFWTFAIPHYEMYQPIVARWNESGRTPRIQMRVLGRDPLERRMMAAFMAGTPSADVMEVERRLASRAFTGPLEAVGFVDLTERLRSEGIFDRMVPASFTPWMSRGRVFGVPHDVHPVMLAYRADVVEAAGIDVSSIRTWDDFERVLRPLQDSNGDGRADRYLINMWTSAAHQDHLEVLLLQAGGGFFDGEDRLRMATEVNARVLARIVRWCHGPDRIAGDAPNFTASGNQLKADGFVLSQLMPDWMTYVWEKELPQLSGKMRVMPLPAWEEGGSRTSVWGGTMLGIPKAAVPGGKAEGARFEELWEFAKHLYLSDDLARDLYTTGRIITPVKDHWDDPIFDEPIGYYRDQAIGREYIRLADAVPGRTSSPFNTMALARATDALTRLYSEARREDPEGEKPLDMARLEGRAMELLREAEGMVRAAMERNVFLREGGRDGTSDGASDGGPRGGREGGNL